MTWHTSIDSFIALRERPKDSRVGPAKTWIRASSVVSVQEDIGGGSLVTMVGNDRFAVLEKADHIVELISKGCA